MLCKLGTWLCITLTIFIFTSASANNEQLSKCFDKCKKQQKIAISACLKQKTKLSQCITVARDDLKQCRNDCSK